MSAAETGLEKTGPTVSDSSEQKTAIDSKGGSVKANAPAQTGNNSGMTQVGPVSISNSKTEAESKTRHAETMVGYKDIAVQVNTKVSSGERDAKMTSKEAVFDHKRGDTSHKPEKNVDVTCVKNLQKTVSDGSGDAVKRGNDASTNNIPIANQNNSKGGGTLVSAGVDDRPDNCDKRALTSAFDVVDTNKSLNNRSTSTVSHFV